MVAAAYLAFVPLDGGRGVNDLPLPAELMLSVGTTAGVVALAVTALAPVRRLRLRLRPALRFPPGIAARVRVLALAGIAAVIAQNLSTVVVIRLANAHGGPGALVLYNYGWQVFFVPYAVLAVPIATSAFPVLSASAPDGGHDAGAGRAAASPRRAPRKAARAAGPPDFDAAAASSTRAAVLASWLGAALLAGACVPAARVFISHDPGRARELAWALAAFAAGLAGFGLAANLSRVLLACRRARIAAIAVAGGWLLVIVADLVIVPLVPAGWVVPALGLGNTIGLTVAGIALVAAVRRARGADALHGVTRAGAAGLAGALAGTAAGLGVCAALPASGFFPNVALVLLAGLSTTLAFGLAALAFDGGELRELAARARAKTGAMRVGYVLGTSAGGTRAARPHAGRRPCRAGGDGPCLRPCRDLGHAGAAPADVPAERGRALLPAGAAEPPRFAAVEIADHPRPSRDLAAVRRLRGLLASSRPDVVHAHGLRAGALAALATGGAGSRARSGRAGSRREAKRPALLVTVHNAPPDRGRGRRRLPGARAARRAQGRRGALRIG